MAPRQRGCPALAAREPFELTLEAGDMLVLCTVGLTGVVPDEDVEEILRAGGSLEETCQRLIDAAEAAGGPDNITVLVGRIEPEHSAPNA